MTLLSKQTIMFPGLRRLLQNLRPCQRPKTPSDRARGPQHPRQDPSQQERHPKHTMRGLSSGDLHQNRQVQSTPPGTRQINPLPMYFLQQIL